LALNLKHSNVPSLHHEGGEPIKHLNKIARLFEGLLISMNTCLGKDEDHKPT
jgi:hypothetical protein